MVYPGRPSKGCGVCRKRRVRCDEGKPECANCTKRGLSCSGYREWSELCFRNQTVATREHHNYQHDDTTVLDFASMPDRQGPADVTPAIEELALENFFTHFVRPHDPPSVHKGYFQVLPGLYSSTSTTSALHSATSAFALATFRVDATGRHCISESRAAYALTLSRIQEELHADLGPTSNETLLAVLLMQVIEALLESGSIEANPESHLDGAMTLVKLRGLKGFQDETSQCLLSSARAQGIMRSFGRSLGLETPFSDSQRAFLGTYNASPDTALSDRPFRSTGLLHTISEVAKLLQVYNRLSTSSDDYQIPDIMDMIENLKRCDVHLVQWADRAQASWHQSSVSGITSDVVNLEAFSGRIDTYTDIFIARSWNYYRVARIFIQVILTRYSGHPLSQNGAGSLQNLAGVPGHEVSILQQKLSDMINDIGASVLFHLGYCPGYKWSATGIGAYFLLWPLLLAQEALPDSCLQKAQIIGQLSEICRSLGLGQSRIAGIVQVVKWRN